MGGSRLDLVGSGTEKNGKSFRKSDELQKSVKMGHFFAKYLLRRALI